MTGGLDGVTKGTERRRREVTTVEGVVEVRSIETKSGAKTRVKW